MERGGTCSGLWKNVRTNGATIHRTGAHWMLEKMPGARAHEGILRQQRRVLRVGGYRRYSEVPRSTNRQEYSFEVTGF